MNCAGKPAKSLFLVVTILFLFVIAGCVPPPQPLTPQMTRLIYPEAKPDSRIQTRNIQLHIQKPDISNVTMYNNMYLMGKGSNLRIFDPSANMNVAGEPRFVTNDNPGDWIAGALAQELRLSGFSVEFINDANDKIENVISITTSLMSLNGSLNNENREVFRTSLKVHFSLYQFGKVIKQFDISNEKDNESLSFKTGSVYNSWNDVFSSMKSSREAVLRDGLQELLKNAVPVIAKTFEGQ